MTNSNLLWADVLLAPTPATDFRFLALPKDVAAKFKLDSGSELYNFATTGGYFIKEPDWRVKFAQGYLFFGCYGETETLVGQYFDGVPIYQDSLKGNGRRTKCFVGWVTRIEGRIEALTFPSNPSNANELMPFKDHGQYFLPYWYGEHSGAHRELDKVTHTQYLHRLNPKPVTVPSHWQASLNEFLAKMHNGDKNFEVILKENKPSIWRDLEALNAQVETTEFSSIDSSNEVEKGIGKPKIGSVQLNVEAQSSKLNQPNLVKPPRTWWRVRINDLIECVSGSGKHTLLILPALIISGIVVWCLTLNSEAKRKQGGKEQEKEDFLLSNEMSSVEIIPRKITYADEVRLRVRNKVNPMYR